MPEREQFHDRRPSLIQNVLVAVQIFVERLCPLNTSERHDLIATTSVRLNDLRSCCQWSSKEAK